MKTKIFILALILTASFSARAEPPTEEGKTIFTSRCAGCHSITKNLTGPALGGVDERHSMEWIISFVQGSQKMVRAGDKEAVALFEQFNKIPMPDHPDLTGENIKNIVAYIKSEKEAAAKAAVTPTNLPKHKTDYLGFSSHNYGLLLTYCVLLILLTSSLIFLTKVKALRREMEQSRV